MTLINNELYKALVEAGASKTVAEAAAKVDKQEVKELEEIKARINVIEKLNWAIALGVVGLVLKMFLS